MNEIQVPVLIVGAAGFHRLPDHPPAADPARAPAQDARGVVPRGRDPLPSRARPPIRTKTAGRVTTTPALPRHPTADPSANKSEAPVHAIDRSTHMTWLGGRRAGRGGRGPRMWRTFHPPAEPFLDLPETYKLRLQASYDYAKEARTCHRPVRIRSID